MDDSLEKAAEALGEEIAAKIMPPIKAYLDIQSAQDEYVIDQLGNLADAVASLASHSAPGARRAIKAFNQRSMELVEFMESHAK